MLLCETSDDDDDNNVDDNMVMVATGNNISMCGITRNIVLNRIYTYTEYILLLLPNLTIDVASAVSCLHTGSLESLFKSYERR